MAALLQYKECVQVSEIFVVGICIGGKDCAKVGVQGGIVTLWSKFYQEHKAGIFIGLAVLIALFFIFDESSQTPARGSASIKNQPYVIDEDSKMINRHLQDLAKKKEMAEMDVQLNNHQYSQDHGHSLSGSRLPQDPLAKGSDEGIYFGSDTRLNEVSKDLETWHHPYKVDSLPEVRINSALEQKKWLQNLELSQREEYIQAFLKQAREDGYEVLLNDQLEVVDINRIPTHKRYKGRQSLEKLAK